VQEAQADSCADEVEIDNDGNTGAITLGTDASSSAHFLYYTFYSQHYCPNNNTSHNLYKIYPKKVNYLLSIFPIVFIATPLAAPPTKYFLFNIYPYY
jgi:hypothetical protein